MYENLTRQITHLTASTPRIGGICTLLAAKWEDVLNWPVIDPDTHMSDSAITLKTGKTWLLLYSSDTERNYTEDLKPSSAGPYITHKISAQVPGESASNTLTMRAAQFHRYVLVVKDKAGVLRLLGNQDAGAEIAHKYDSGTRDNSRKRTLEFTWDHSVSAPLLAAQTFIIDGIEVDDMCAVVFPPCNPKLIGSGRAVNEQINLYGVTDYTLAWNSTRITNYGTAGFFQVFIKDPGTGEYISTLIAITPDDPVTPTSYYFDFGGIADVLIVIS